MTDPRGLAASFLPPWFEHGLGHYHIEFPPGCYSGNCDKWRAGAEDRASAWEQRMAYWCVDVYQDMKKDCPGICSFLVKSLVDAAVYEGYDWLPGEIEKDINYRRCMTACDVGSLVTAGGCVAAVVVVYAAWTIGILGLYLGCVREHGHGDYTVIVRPPPDIEA